MYWASLPCKRLSRPGQVYQRPEWNVVTSPNFDLGNNNQQGLTVISTNAVWAVGEYANSSNVNRTLIEHFC